MYVHHNESGDQMPRYINRDNSEIVDLVAQDGQNARLKDFKGQEFVTPNATLNAHWDEIDESEYED